MHPAKGNAAIAAPDVGWECDLLVWNEYVSNFATAIPANQ
jgi:hypothetical protein